MIAGLRRTIEVIALLTASSMSACRRTPETRPSRAVSREGAAFYGTISDLRTMTIRADEQEVPRSRRAEIWVSPATEITDRRGSLVPFEALRRGMRVTVWFTPDYTETDVALQGRARKIVVEY